MTNIDVNFRLYLLLQILTLSYKVIETIPTNVQYNGAGKLLAS